MGKPASVKTVQVLAVLQILINIAAIALLVWLVDAHPTSEFWMAVKDGFDQGMAQNGFVFTYEAAGYASAVPIIGIIACILTLIGIHKHTKKWGYTTLIALGFHFLSSIINGGQAALSALMFFLLLVSKKARAYMGLGDESLVVKKS